MIDGKTRLCGLIGQPVEHSLSPVMQNTAFAALGLNFVYLAFNVENGELTAVVQGLKALKIRGFNITMPYKTEIIPLLDHLDPMAVRIGAVNTVVNDDGRLTGFNTDHSGFIFTMRQNGINLGNSKSVLLGSGGAARAVAYALAEECAEMIILNRPEGLGRANKLANDITRDNSIQIAVKELNAANLKEALADAALLVNATSVGMNPHPEISPVPAGLLHKGLSVADMVYDPTPTRLIQEAQAAGCRTVDGISLLAAQAEKSFELWTGESAPPGLMLTTGREARERSIAQNDTKSGIALIGFMGSGKSRTGKILAQKLGLRLFDTDQVIEERSGQSIESLFSEHGEKRFREWEKNVVREVSEIGESVIACGGGVVLDAANMLALRQSSLIIYLKSSPASLLKRVRASRTRRPLLAGRNKAGAIERLLAERLPLYAAWADITVDTSDKNAEIVAREICTRVKQYESQSV